MQTENVKDEFFVGTFFNHLKTSINPKKEKDKSEAPVGEVKFSNKNIKVVEENKLFILKDRGHCCASIFGVNCSNNSVDGEVFWEYQLGYELDEKSFKLLLYSNKDPYTSNNLLETIKDVEKRDKKCVYGKLKNDQYTKVLFKDEFDKDINEFKFNSDKDSVDWEDYLDGYGNMCYITSKDENLYETIKNKKQQRRDLVRKIVDENKEKLMGCKSSFERNQLAKDLTKKYIPQEQKNSLDESFYNENNNIDDYYITIDDDGKILIDNIATTVIKYDYQQNRFLNVNSGNNCLHSELDLMPKDGKDYIEIKRIIVDLRPHHNASRMITNEQMGEILNMSINEIKSKDIRIIDKDGINQVMSMVDFINQYCKDEKLKNKYLPIANKIMQLPDDFFQRKDLVQKYIENGDNSESVIDDIKAISRCEDGKEFLRNCHCNIALRARAKREHQVFLTYEKIQDNPANVNELVSMDNVKSWNMCGCSCC